MNRHVAETSILVLSLMLLTDAPANAQRGGHAGFGGSHGGFGGISTGHGGGTFQKLVVGRRVRISS